MVQPGDILPPHARDNQFHVIVAEFKGRRWRRREALARGGLRVVSVLGEEDVAVQDVEKGNEHDGAEKVDSLAPGSPNNHRGGFDVCSKLVIAWMRLGD